MKQLFVVFIGTFFLANASASAFQDSLRSYSNLSFSGVEKINAAPGTKSVLFNSTGTKLYAMNLEGLSVIEFDAASRKKLNQYKFKPTKGKGWDYTTKKQIPSIEEKPVEACLSNDDKILWVSLHNAGGIVAINTGNCFTTVDTFTNKQFKQLSVYNYKDSSKKNICIPLIKTGSTPKVIAKTSNDSFLLVSNWHSQNISVLKIADSFSTPTKLVKNIPVTAIPRGIVVDDKNNKTYVAIMGGSTITVINNKTWSIEKNIQVAANPRHIVMDTSGHLFVSYNLLNQIACIDIATGKTLFKDSTHLKPRTIVLSKNKQFLFVTCYEGNMMDVFKIEKDSFKKLYSLSCPGKPVGIDLYEDDTKIEAWVCNYVGGNINIFTFKKH
jgi:DNA-binding beta-propeller fold protein YncE